MTLKSLPLDHIHLNPFQMWSLDHNHVAELSADIAANGLLQLPKARPHPEKTGHVQLAFGHHRRAAVHQLGWVEMPIEVEPLTDVQMATFAAVENFRRREVTALDKARVLQSLTQPPLAMTHAQAAAVVGLKDPASVSNLIKLLKLPPAVQESVGRGDLPERVARQLVSLAPLAKKRIETVAKAVAKAKPAEREAVLEEQVDALMRRAAKSLHKAEWDAHWLRTPIPVEHPADGQPAELRACAGCPHVYRRGGNEFCTLLACYELKEQRFISEQLARAAERLGVPVVAEGEKTQPVFREHNWSAYEDTQTLLKLWPNDESLGLRLGILKEAAYYNGRTFGATRIGLFTLDKAACERAITAASRRSSAPAAPSPAALEKERAARRAERAAALRLEHDLAWLLRTASEWIGDALTISGRALHYVVELLVCDDDMNARHYPAVWAWYEAMKEQAAKVQGYDGAANEIRRRRLVAAQLVSDCIDAYTKDSPAKVWHDALDQLAARAERRHEDGLVVFGVNPPKGWDHPPVHKTDYNCWTCGVFHGGARRKLSKADFERGWRIVEQGQTVLSVACPDCAATTQPASAPGKPKPVGAPLMGARPVTAPKPKKKGARRR